jgi:HSP20 family molecular chaperone IbpA
VARLSRSRSLKSQGPSSAPARSRRCIEASFKKGVLTVTLPKKPDAQKPEKKIEVKSAA